MASNVYLKKKTLNLTLRSAASITASAIYIRVGSLPFLSGTLVLIRELSRKFDPEKESGQRTVTVMSRSSIEMLLKNIFVAALDAV